MRARCARLFLASLAGVGMLMQAGCRKPIATPDSIEPALKLAQETASSDSAPSAVARDEASLPPPVPDEASLYTTERVGSITRIGSAAEIHRLIELLTSLPAGEQKSALCRSLDLAGRSELHPWLFEVFLVVQDAEVSRALKQQMTGRATTELLAAVISAHDESSDPAVQTRALEFLQECSSDESAETLGTEWLEGGRPISEPVNAAIARALASNGSPMAVDALLARLSRTENEQEVAFVSGLMKTVARSEAQAQLLGAAQGNKMASTIESRVASIQALANFPTSETLEVMQRLSTDGDPRIQRVSSQIAAICTRVLAGSK